jgi:broad specificity phosphatase PhoE
MGAIYLLRHGQASFGSHNYDQLSATGHEQARVLGRALKARGVLPEVLIAGSMQRHRETAHGALSELGLSPELPVPSLQTHEGVNEFDHENVIEVAEPRYVDKLVMMGEMAATGDPRRAFQKFFQDAVSRWVGGNHDDEYKEPWSVFKLRCVRALDDLVQQTPPKGTTLVFTSGGTISVICAHLLGLSDAQAFTINWTLANAGITKVLSGRDGLHLISVNEHAHLEGGQPGMLTYR